MGANIYKNKKPLFLFLVPAFAFMAIFLYYPFIQNILNSFKQITELGAASKGWNDPWYTNYVTMFQDENNPHDGGHHRRPGWNRHCPGTSG